MGEHVVVMENEEYEEYVVADKKAKEKMLAKHMEDKKVEAEVKG